MNTPVAGCVHVNVILEYTFMTMAVGAGKLYISDKNTEIKLKISVYRLYSKVNRLST